MLNYFARHFSECNILTNLKVRLLVSFLLITLSSCSVWFGINPAFIIIFLIPVLYIWLIRPSINRIHDAVNTDQHVLINSSVQSKSLSQNIEKNTVNSTDDQLKNVIRELTTIQHQLSSMIEHAPAPIAMLDKEMRYVAYSQRWISDYKIQSKNIAGKSHYEIFPEIPDHWKQIHQDCLKGAVKSCKEDEFQREDGSVQWINWEIRPWFDANEEIAGIVMYTEDITERKQYSENLKQAFSKAEESSEAKSTFLANMSHEIRTPMTSILGFTEQLIEEAENDNVSAQTAEMYKIIYKNGNHLLGLINDILDISKIESGKFTIESIQFSIKDLLSDVSDLVKINCKRKNIDFNLDYETDIAECIQADPTRVKQVLINLIGNAIKFTNEGAVSVTVRMDKPGNALMIRIKDTGIGIPESQLQNIFDSFMQADSTLTRKFGGTGLGLSISKKLAGMMGGDIKIVNSVEYEGTTIEFQLDMGDISQQNIIPIDKLKNHEVENNNCSCESNEIIQGDSIEGVRILLAEDSIDNQKLISRILEKKGAHVSVAGNGKIAIEKFMHERASDHPFDVILMDMQMPVMDGYEAVRELRAKGIAISIIALTAHAMTSDKEKCLAAGCDDFATKPVDQEDLINRILQNTTQKVENVI